LLGKLKYSLGCRRYFFSGDSLFSMEVSYKVNTIAYLLVH
jgi:hypothetical protein